MILHCFFFFFVEKLNKKVYLAFASKWLSNWKDTKNCFSWHKQSKCHLESLQILVKLLKLDNIGSSCHAQSKSFN